MKFNQQSAVLKSAVTNKCSLFFGSIGAELPNKEDFFYFGYLAQN